MARTTKRSNATRYLPAGTRVVINDSQRLNAAGEIVAWAHQKHALYGHAEAALVRMSRFGNLVVLPHHTITEVL